MGQRLRHRTVALLRASCIAPAVQGLQPGQFYASQVQIATQLHWARKTVGTALQRLAGKALLEVNTSDKGTIITVMYWEEISSGRGFQEEPPRENPVLFPLPAKKKSEEGSSGSAADSFFGGVQSGLKTSPDLVCPSVHQNAGNTHHPWGIPIQGGCVANAH